MQDIPKGIVELLSRFGITEQSIRLIRFGGVVGKLTLIALITMGGLAIVAVRTNSTPLLWGCLISMVVTGLLSLAAVSFHGHKHPLEATLEGGQIEALKKVEQEFAVKGVSMVPGNFLVQEGWGRKEIEGKTDGDKQIEAS